ncbi:MAG: hypothetical protein LBH18_06250, partial [Spirochaetaceae bacterium]|nr:hypothetical protein [Spirochaetaceae bacterium]
MKTYTMFYSSYIKNPVRRQTDGESLDWRKSQKPPRCHRTDVRRNRGGVNRALYARSTVPPPVPLKPSWQYAKTVYAATRLNSRCDYYLFNMLDTVPLNTATDPPASIPSL